MLVASDEATSGSVIAKQERISPASSGSSHRRFCSRRAVADEHLHVAGVGRRAVEDLGRERRRAPHDLAERRVLEVGQPGAVARSRAGTGSTGPRRAPSASAPRRSRVGCQRSPSAICRWNVASFGIDVLVHERREPRRRAPRSEVERHAAHDSLGRRARTRRARSGRAKRLDWPALVAYLRDGTAAAHAFAARHDRARVDVSLAVSRRPLEPDVSASLRRCRTRAAPAAARAGAAEGARHGARVPWLAAVHPVFPLAPRAVCCSARTRRDRLGLLRHGAPPRTRRAPRGAAGARRISRTSATASAKRSSTRSPICTPSTSTTGALAALGKPAGFVARQVRGWTERWHRSKTTPTCRRWTRWPVAAQRMPPDAVAPAVVHGDFKLDNVLLDPLDLGGWSRCSTGR